MPLAFGLEPSRDQSLHHWRLKFIHEIIVLSYVKNIVSASYTGRNILREKNYHTPPTTGQSCTSPIVTKWMDG